jgi:hypothetical protein
VALVVIAWAFQVKRGIIEKTPEPAGAGAANVKKRFVGYGDELGFGDVSARVAMCKNAVDKM